jgi:hypothetical protein
VRIKGRIERQLVTGVGRRAHEPEQQRGNDQNDRAVCAGAPRTRGAPTTTRCLTYYAVTCGQVCSIHV